MNIQTRLFGDVTVDMEKVIHFENGIIGFPEMKSFILIYDKDNEESSKISWLQSIEEPAFALPVINPLLVMEDYNPEVEEELLGTLSDSDNSNLLLLNTITIPAELEKMTVNLKAPIIIDAETKKARQVVVDNEIYPVKYPVYDVFKSSEEKVGV